MLELRRLNPVHDLLLFREAYDWRARHKPEGRMTFEQFTTQEPGQAVLGLFNGEFIGVYVVQEYAPNSFDMHFSSKRHSPREYLVAGGIKLTNLLIESGAIEVSAIIMARNHVLKSFLEDCKYTLEREMTFPESRHTWLRYVAV